MAALRVQVVEGKAWEPSRTFAPGVAVGPLGLGREAEWVIDAPGAAPLHAYLYFDGAALFVATAQGDVPTTLNGAAAGQAWTPVLAPSEIRLGGARLLVSEALGLGPPNVADEEEEDPASVTKLNPLPPAAAPAMIEDVATSFFVPKPPVNPGPAAPAIAAVPMPAAGRRSGNVAPPVSDDSTRFLPIEQMRKEAEAAAPVAPLPAAGMPYRPPAPPAAMGEATAPLPPAPPPPALSADSTQPPTSLGPPAQPAPPPVATPAGASALKQAWTAAPPIRKALFFLLPVALIAFVSTMMPTKTGRPPSDGPRARPSASAATSVEAPTLPPATSATPADLVTGPLLGPPPPPPPPPVKGRPPPKPPAPTTTAAEKTTERKAVDALADGNFVEALRLYDQLAAEHPDIPAFREAARILRANAETAKKP